MEVWSDGTGLTYKRARTDTERQRLDHEAAVLRQIPHPGLVQLLGTEGAEPPETLVMRTVSGGNLTELGAQPAAAIAGLGAAVATTIADLHTLGFSHGSIEAAHVLLDEDGRPVLCSLGGADRTGRAALAQGPGGDDVTALARMLLQLLPVGAPRQITRTLQRVGRAGPGHRYRDPRWLAGRLASIVPDAHLPDREPGAVRADAADERPGPSSPAGEAAVDRHRRRFAAAIGLSIVVSGAAVISQCETRPRAASTERTAPPPATRTVSVAAPPLCPAADDGCVPVATPGGILSTPTARYQLGRPGDVIVVGRWNCETTAFPALLRLATGDIWTFDSWPTPSHPVDGRLAGHVASAWTLRVQPEPTGCDRIVVERRDLPSSTIVGAAS